MTPGGLAGSLAGTMYAKLLYKGNLITLKRELLLESGNITQDHLYLHVPGTGGRKGLSRQVPLY